MNAIQIEIVGLIAASFTTFAFVPQVFKIWKNRNASGVSISMYVIMLIGISIWLYYGLLIKSVAVITANIVSGLLQLFIIIFTLINRKNEK
ncbi:MAG: hypothetical protein CND43_01930 [Flavobacteriales bacterium MED-G15]|nr:MAG: hypothetical protein CND43_01930 [Flavobacteriales bacterium MED-G15]|tara:strand:- start:14042 stop:14314 length:273 start_codon:yes stop_codon:yes gene_type:complete